MAGTKLEIKMKKAEPGSWAKLFVPREVGINMYSNYFTLKYMFRN